MMRVLGAVALSLALTGCDVTSDGEALTDASAWTYIGELAYAPQDDELLTAAVELADAAQGFALFAEVDGCAQVARLEDDTSTWVSALESGPSCAACEERFSVIAGAGLLVHLPPEPRAGPARLRLGKIDCETLTRARPSADTPASSVRLWVRELPTLPRELVVPLRFHHGRFSPRASDAESEALLAEAAALLAPTGIRVVLDGSSTDDTLPDSIPWFEGDPSALEPHVEPEDGVVDVVFAGCLEHVHPELGTHTLLDGLVPRIPAQAAPGAGIFLRGRACTAASLGPISVPVESQARVLAHELGHYLGLYHRLEDTDADTLMAPNPALVANPVFSPAQAERMRLHAALLSEPMPDR
ncbi:hypothetical protein DB30_03865 [Enhygromyxa salina]|uniref:Uncharacterized protein n=1 Tax=Enhygromyxa salina TaxID=215803 RepID=A0A0C1ZP47_9BACT|nr:hypothetical protein DB30_03865 [Enhygromyxa salina]